MKALSRRATLAWAMVAVMQTCAVASVGAQSVPTVAVGETGHVTGDRVVAALLHDTLESELRGLDGVRVQTRAAFVVRGAVTRLDRHRDPNGDLQVRCEVSLVVAEARGGSIRLMLSGGASARGPGEDAARLEQDAMHAAVRGAVRPLGRTLVSMR